MEKRNVPRLRFPAFQNGEDYTLQSFEDIFTFSTGKNIKQSEASPSFTFLCVRYGELYHMYGEVIDEVINKTNLDKSELLFSEGNEILLPSAGEDPMDIGSASALTIADVAIGRTINILKPLKSRVYSPAYAAYYINERLRKKISSLAKGVSISNVYNSDLRTLQITLPSFEEQQKVELFLSSINSKIKSLKKKKTLLEQYKKGMMQKIFNQEIRFQDEDGKEFEDWEERMLSDCLDYEQPTNYLVSSTDYNDDFATPVLTAGKTFILGYTDETNGIFEKNLPVIIFDDFTTATQFVDFPFKAKSSAMKILKANENCNIKYIYEVMQGIKHEIGGHGRHWISVFSQMEIAFPSIEEQTKIANFLSAIDDKINLVAVQIEKMEKFKKGLLGEMFV
ncbi:MAG: restriction endonuclease subunit S [Flavobacterium sp.]|nr:MAG: restriction endonuclease subunit S [Flavobacterium sp.]